MERIRFQILGGLPAELAERVPVEVFDMNNARAAVGVAGEGVDLDPGIYAARATLPDGAEFSGAFRADAAAGPVTLSPVGGPIRLRPSGSGEPDLALSGDVAAQAAPSAAPRAKYRVVTGNLLSGRDVRSAWREVDLDAEQVVEGGASPSFIEVGAAGQPAWFVAVPVRAGEHRRFRLVQRDGEVMPHMVFDDPDLELLLRYLGAGDLASALDLTHSSRKFDPATLVEDAERPLTAMLAAYGLLRGRGFREVAPFIAALPERFPWSPDARVLHAELLARQGEHQQACERILELAQVGLPFFSSGLAYALNRLQQYQLLLARGRLEAPNQAFHELGAKLEWVAGRTDHGRPILTFRPPATPTSVELARLMVEGGWRTALDALRLGIRQTRRLLRGEPDAQASTTSDTA